MKQSQKTHSSFIHRKNRSITMSQKQHNPKEVAHALRVVNEQLTELRKQMHGKVGEERAAIEKKIHELLTSIGMDSSNVELRDGAEAEGATSIAATLLTGVQAATEAAAKIAAGEAAPKQVDVKVTGADGETVNTTTTVSVEKPSLWVRFKAWCAANKKKAVAGGLALVAGAVGLWVWLTGKNTAVAVSSVADVDVAVEPVTIEPTTPTVDAEPSIFTRMGEWIADAASVAKGYAVSAWTWVKGLFTRNNDVEVTVETPVEIPAAA
jgi:hypothetical protein